MSASRLDKVRARLAPAPSPSPSADVKKEQQLASASLTSTDKSNPAGDGADGSSSAAPPPATEAENAEALATVLGQYRQMRASWRTGFFTLPLAVALMTSYFLYAMLVKPFEGDASVFAPLVRELEPGTLCFGLSLHVLVCLLSAAGNWLASRSVVWVAFLVSLVPLAALGGPFLPSASRSALIRLHPFLAWVPLVSFLVAGAQLLLESMWDRMEAEVMGAFGAGGVGSAVVAKAAAAKKAKAKAAAAAAAAAATRGGPKVKGGL